MTVATAEAVTAASAASILVDKGSDAASAIAASNISAEWVGLAMFAIVALSALVKWLQVKAKGTATQADDIALDAAEQTLKKTKDKLGG